MHQIMGGSSGTGARRLFAAALVAGLVAACAATPASSPSTPVAPTALPTASSSPLPTAAPMSSATTDSWVQACRAKGSSSEPVSLSAIAPAGPGMVVAGDFGSSNIRAAAWTSRDGSVWTEAQLPGSDGVFPNAIAANSGGSVIGATAGDSEGAVAWHSGDGLTWERVTLDAGTGIRAAAAGASSHVLGGLAVGGRPVLWSSPDGIHWTRRSLGVEDRKFGFIRGIVAGGPGFVAWGLFTDTPLPDVFGASYQLPADAGVPWTSVEGTTWTRAADASPFAGAWITSIVLVGSRLLAFGQVGTDPIAATWSSDDGLAWTRLPEGPPAIGGSDYFVALGDGRVLELAQPASGSPIAAWLSADGVTWRPVGELASAAWAIQGVIRHGASIIAVGTPDSPAAQTGCVPLPIWTRSIGSFGAGG